MSRVNKSILLYKEDLPKRDHDSETRTAPVYGMKERVESRSLIQQKSSTTTRDKESAARENQVGSDFVPTIGVHTIEGETDNHRHSVVLPQKVGEGAELLTPWSMVSMIVSSESRHDRILDLATVKSKNRRQQKLKTT